MDTYCYPLYGDREILKQAPRTLRDKGLVVFTGVFGEQYCDAWMESILACLNALEPSLGLSASDHSGWTRAKVPAGSRGGHMQTLVNAFPVVRQLRSHKILHTVFAAMHKHLLRRKVDVVPTLEGIEVCPNAGKRIAPGKQKPLVRGQAVLCDMDVNGLAVPRGSLVLWLPAKTKMRCQPSVSSSSSPWSGWYGVQYLCFREPDPVISATMERAETHNYVTTTLGTACIRLSNSILQKTSETIRNYIEHPELVSAVVPVLMERHNTQ